MTLKRSKNIIIFLLCLTPLLIILFSVFRNGASDIETSINYVTDLYNDYLPSIFSDFKDFFTINLDFSSTGFSFAFDYLVYVFMVEIVSLIFDFILFIPRWVKGVIFKYEK